MAVLAQEWWVRYHDVEAVGQFGRNGERFYVVVVCEVWEDGEAIVIFEEVEWWAGGFWHAVYDFAEGEVDAWGRDYGDRGAGCGVSEESGC